MAWCRTILSGASHLSQPASVTSSAVASYTVRSYHRASAIRHQWSRSGTAFGNLPSVLPNKYQRYHPVQCYQQPKKFKNLELRTVEKCGDGSLLFRFAEPPPVTTAAPVGPTDPLVKREERYGPERTLETLPTADLTKLADSRPPMDRDLVVARTPTGEWPAKVTKLEVGGFMIPHPAKQATGGEDAWFIAANQLAMGVADGVGGWARHGIDAGLFSRSLMSLVRQRYEASGAASCSELIDILASAHAATGDPGSATVCLAALDKESVLHLLVLGDSGCLVLRDGEIVFKSAAQQKAFNFPYQIGNAGPSESPGDALLYELELQQGDVIVLATDGVLDNLFDEDVVKLLLETRRQKGSAQIAAQLIAVAAQAKARDKTYDSPFAINARKAGRLYVGGKMDDITALVAFTS
eukprot:jgi/Mesvir1/6127/Mv00831-RA.1